MRFSLSCSQRAQPQLLAVTAASVVTAVASSGGGVSQAKILQRSRLGSFVAARGSSHRPCSHESQHRGRNARLIACSCALIGLLLWAACRYCTPAHGFTGGSRLPVWFVREPSRISCLVEQQRRPQVSPVPPGHRPKGRPGRRCRTLVGLQGREPGRRLRRRLEKRRHGAEISQRDTAEQGRRGDGPGRRGGPEEVTGQVPRRPCQQPLHRTAARAGPGWRAIGER